MQQKEIMTILGITSILSIILIFSHIKNANAVQYIVSPLSITGNSTMIAEDGQITTNSASGSSCPNTSYSKSISGTTIQIVKGNSLLSLSCSRAYVEFNTIFIPNDAVITAASLVLNVNTVTNSGAKCDITSVNDNNNRPVLATAGTVWSDIGSGTVYISNSATCQSTGSKTYTLTGQALTDIQNSLSTRNWFAVGIKFNSETRQALTNQTNDDSTESATSGNRPSLSVTWTTLTTTMMITGNSASDITQDGYISTSSATGASCPSPSSKNTADTILRAQKDTSASSGLCRRGFMEFNTTALSDNGITINEIALIDDTNQALNIINCDVNPLTNKPSSTASASTLWTDIGDGTSYFSSDSNICGTAHGYYTKNGFLFPTSAKTDLTSGLSVNWWGFGFKFTDETRDGTQKIFDLRSSDSSATQTAKLLVQYSLASAPSDTVLVSETRIDGIATSFSDLLSITENRLSNAGKVLDDVLILSEDNRLFDINKLLNDNVLISESLTHSFVKVLNDDIAITENLLMNGVLSVAFSDFVILMDNLETSQENGGIDWGLFTGLFVLVPMIILLPIIAIRRRRR